MSSDVPSDVVQSFEGQQLSLLRRGRRIRGRGRKQGSGFFCYICGDPNHIRPDCPHSRDCYRCLKPGHVARDCTSKVGRYHCSTETIACNEVSRYSFTSTVREMGDPCHESLLQGLGNPSITKCQSLYLFTTSVLESMVAAMGI